MLSLRLSRLHFRTADAPASSRLEVCPPLAFEPAESGFRRWLRRLGAPRAAAGSQSPEQQLRTVREEFAQALNGLESQHAQYLQHKIRHIRSMRDLWHLRAEMFVLIAQGTTEQEAQQRMAPLARHFPSRGQG